MPPPEPDNDEPVTKLENKCEEDPTDKGAMSIDIAGKPVSGKGASEDKPTSDARGAGAGTCTGVGAGGGVGVGVAVEADPVRIASSENPQLKQKRKPACKGTPHLGQNFGWTAAAGACWAICNGGSCCCCC